MSRFLLQINSFFRFKSSLLLCLILLSIKGYAQPTITSFSSSAGKAGDAITITGTGFNSTAAQNIVRIGGMKCTVTAASSTSLTVTLPNHISTGYFFVTNKGTSLTGISSKQFIAQTSNTLSSYSTTTFASATSLISFGNVSGNGSISEGDYSFVDINEDGKGDVVVFDNTNYNLTYYSNGYTSGTVSSSNFTSNILKSGSHTGYDAKSTLVFDYDNDGDLDFYCAREGSGSYYSVVYTNNTSSSTITVNSTGTNITGLGFYGGAPRLADINLDGQTDFMSTYTWWTHLSENTSSAGSPSFNYTSVLNSGVGSTGYAVPLDINGDGTVDVASSMSVASLSYYENNTSANAATSSYSFTAASNLTISNAYAKLIEADLNQDGKPDIVAYSGTNLDVIQNNSTSTSTFGFATKATTTTAYSTSLIRFADMNNDGKLDMLVAEADNYIYLYLNTTSSVGGTISFGSAVKIINAGTIVTTMHVVDFNNDGYFDVICTGATSGLKYFQNGGPTTPLISVTGTLAAFSSCAGTASTSKSFSASGTNLSANIVITPPSGYEVSTSSSSGFASSVTLTQTSGTVSATTIYARIASTATGTPSGNIALTSTSATTVNVAVSGTVNALPTISGVTTVDKLGTTQLSGSGTANSTTPWTSASTAVATVDATGVVTGVTVGTSVITYTANTGCSNTTTVTVLPNEFYIKASASTAAATLSSWGPNSDGSGTAPTDFVYPKVFHLTNSAGTTTFSAGSVDWGMYGQLDIPSGKTLNLSSGYSLNLTTNGTLTNSGTINGTSSSMGVFGSGSQTLGGTINIGDVNIDNEFNVTISGTMTVYGTMNITVINTLYPTGSLIFHSDVNGTGRLGSVNGAISGNITIEQYIPGGYRKFRFFAHPFSTSKDLTMLTDDFDVTGTGGSTNGFTTTGTNNPSAFWFNTSNADGATNNGGWTAFTKPDGTGTGNTWAKGQGIRALVRGAKGEGLTTTNYTPSAVTLDMTGPANVGDVTINLSSAGSSSGQGLNLVGNPYPSPVDISSVVFNSASASLLNKTIYTRNPQTGSYESQTLSSGTPYSIPSSTCFFIKATSGTPSITFSEWDKTSSSSLTTAARISSINANGIRLGIKMDTLVYDQLDFYFDDNLKSDFEGQFDAFKLNNDVVNFYSLSSDKTPLCVDFRKFNEDEIIPLGVRLTGTIAKMSVSVDQNTLVSQQYPYLYDLYLNQVVQLKAGEKYDFTVNQSDSSSFGEKRFKLSFNGNLLNNVSFDLNQDGIIYPNPVNNQFMVKNHDQLKSITVKDLNGQLVFCKSLGNGKYDMSQCSPGIYIVEIIHHQGDIQKQKIIKQD